MVADDAETMVRKVLEAMAKVDKSQAFNGPG